MNKLFKPATMLLVLIGLYWLAWGLNINKASFLLTPWENYGTPPETPIEIINISKVPDKTSPVHFRATVFVETENGIAYQCCAKGNETVWEKKGPGYEFALQTSKPEWDKRWGIPDRSRDALSYETYVLNTSSGEIALVVYQIKNNAIFGKLVYESPVIKLLKNTQKYFLKPLSILFNIYFIVVLWKTNSLSTLIQSIRSLPVIRIRNLTLWTIALLMVGFSLIYRSALQRYAGEYVRTDGFWSWRLSIYPNGSYKSIVRPDFGGPFKDQGWAVLVGDKIKLISNKDDGSIVSKAYLYPISWGERKYMVDDFSLEEFCIHGVSNLGYEEPRTEINGLFYLQDGDWDKPADGVPVLLFGQAVCPSKQ